MPQRRAEEEISAESKGSPPRGAATRTCAGASETLALQSNTLQSQIETWEAEIDALVYQLYRLTEEEIVIVAGA